MGSSSAEDRIDVLKIPQQNDTFCYYMNNILDPEPGSVSSGLSGGEVSGVVIGSIALASIMVLVLWRFRTYVRKFIMCVFKTFWVPR